MVGGVTAASGGRSMERGDLLSLQGRMKRDPAGYESELLLQRRHFDACLSIFLLHPSTSSGTTASSHDPGAAKDMADMAMFLAHMTPVYPQHLGQFPKQLLQLLGSQGTSQQPTLRRHLTQALILLRNRKVIDLVDTLPVLMDLQCSGDRVIKRLAFLHIVQDIRRMNLKHRNEPTNRALQNVLFNLLQGEDESKAKRSLVVLAELHRRKVWVDERTSNAICTACFHKSSRIMIASLQFLLGYDRKAEDDDDEDGSSSDDEASKVTGTPGVSREDLYKAYHKGTTSSRRKKQAKLQRVQRSLQKQQRTQSQSKDQGRNAPLQHVHDPQSFAEKLFARLQSCNERFEVKLMMMLVISRAVGMHRLTLLNLYPFLQRYIQPHQRDVTQLLAAAVQACHDLVPPDAVETMIRQLVNQFVHDRARPEVMAVGLNVVREICMRIPLIMTKELLTDLALYKKSREKAVAAAARSIISVYRQVWPALLEKKDRGRGADLSARPKAFGETVVASDVPGADLLLEDDVESVEGSDDNSDDGEDEDGGNATVALSGEDEMGSELDISDSEGDDFLEEMDNDSDEGDEEGNDESDEGKEGMRKRKAESKERTESASGDHEAPLADGPRKKQKIDEAVEGQGTPVVISEQSLRNLKKLAAAKVEEKPRTQTVSQDGDGIFSNEDFERIRRLQVKRATRAAMAEHGMSKAGKRRHDVAVKLASNESLGEKPVNPAYLEARIHKRKEKEERVAAARAGREDRPQFGARTAMKQKKTGGTSNRQKEKTKGMPLAAKRAKVARSREQKRVKGRAANKQFRGKKAWKQ